MSRYAVWLRRVSFETKSGVPVGSLEVTWRESFHDHPAYGSLAQRYADLGRSGKPDWYVTRNLLRDVIHAAGGAEYALDHIEALLPDAPEAARFAKATEVGWEFSNFVLWIRAFQDRLKHTTRGQREVGLLPALADDRPPLATLKPLYEDLRKSTLADVCKLANHVTHNAAIPAGDLALQPDGTVPYLAPDPLPARAGVPFYLPDDFTFDDGRDLRGFAHQTFERVAAFVDVLIETSGPVSASAPASMSRWRAARAACAARAWSTAI